MRRLVVLEARGTSDFVDSLRRAWDDGDAVFPLDPRLPAPARAEVLAAARPDEPAEDGDALVVATSGTTGTPKAAVLTHDAVGAAAQATSARLGVDPAGDRWLACLPLAHVGGLGVVTRALHTGTPLTVTPDADADTLVEAVRAGCTLVSLVPALLPRIRSSAFRWLLLGGSAMPPDLPPNAVPTYGLTETGGGVVYDGVPLDGVELGVAGDDGNIRPLDGSDAPHGSRADDGDISSVDGTAHPRSGRDSGGSAATASTLPPELSVGEIAVRGPMLLRAYRDGSDPKDPQGWLRTGDAGRWDDDAGRLRVQGRIGDVIVTGGEKVWPVLVEQALATHPDVREVAVFGRDDPVWGQRVVARLVPARADHPPTLDSLRGLVKETLPPWAAPRELELVTALPRTRSGKVARRLLIS